MYFRLMSLVLAIIFQSSFVSAEVNIQDIRDFFEDLHNASETIYRFNPETDEYNRNIQHSWGNGYEDWPQGQDTPDNDHPLIRDAARRILGYISYLRAYPNNETYSDRVEEALDYLVIERRAEPTYYYYLYYNDAPHSDVVPVSLASVALLEGYRINNYTNRTTYKQYAESTESYQVDHCSSAWWSNANENETRTGYNANYIGQQAQHLALLYSQTTNYAYLDEAVQRAYYIATVTAQYNPVTNTIWWADKDNNGNSHDEAIWYHCIALRGIVKTLAMMSTTLDARVVSIPWSSPDTITYGAVRASLETAIIRGLNNILDRRVGTTGNLYKHINETDGTPLIGEFRPDPYALQCVTRALWRHDYEDHTQRNQLNDLADSMAVQISRASINYVNNVRWGNPTNNVIGKSDTAEFMMALGDYICYQFICYEDPAVSLKSAVTYDDMDDDYSEDTQVSSFQTSVLPNPFNPTTNIQFELPNEEHVQLNVYNLAGQLITTLVDRTMEKGYHSVTFDASGLPSSIYLYQISAGGLLDTGKMTLVR